MRILITGGTGSLGHALARHYMEQTAHRVVILSRDEYKQAAMAELFSRHREQLEFFLGDVRDLSRMRMAMDAQFDLVIHAAALKRVDSVAKDPDEVYKTNVEGTRNVLIAAKGRAKRVLLVSSDKACYPSNAYGVTKAMAERLTLGFNVYAVGTPACSVIRYGNVLGSRGSVLEVWRRALDAGEPLPVTDYAMTRFVLTLDRAVAVIEQAHEWMHGGEVFVPLLPTARLVDMAEAFAPETEVQLTGLRPGGEKLHETLVMAEETVTPLDGRYNANSETGWPRLSVGELRVLFAEAGLLP